MSPSATKRMSRTILVCVIILFSILVALLLLNISGWRARIISRITRVDNKPVIVRLPMGFQPWVPAGFRVSVFATGFVSPRWLAVLPEWRLVRGRLLCRASNSHSLRNARRSAQNGHRPLVCTITIVLASNSASLILVGVQSSNTGM